MEVHHHAHHSGKKSWKTYFFEFFMLFFAVFCGFLAEYQLEHVVENNREKQFINSLVEDVQTDTTQITELFVMIKDGTTKLDSLLIELSGDNIKADSRKALNLWIRSTGFPDFIYNDRTIQQLKHSGSLRLIRSTKVSNALMKYDRVVRALFIHQEIMNQFIVNNTIYSKLFDFIGIKKNRNPLPLPTESVKLLNEAYANRVMWRMYMEALSYRLTDVRKEAEKLIFTIKTEYPVK